MPLERPTVREVVIAFMTIFSTSLAPHERLATFLENLRKDGRWTPEEIDEVRRSIEDRLQSVS